MLDIGRLRRDPSGVRALAIRRNGDASFVERALEIDARLRAGLTTVEGYKAEKNALTSLVARAPDRAAEAQRLRPQIAALDERIASESAELPELEAAIERILAEVPNLLDPSVPPGNDDGANVVVRTHGQPPAFAFAPKPHWELGEALDILDFDRATKLSGSRFSVLRGKGAQLSRALANFFLDRAAVRGYLEIAPPYLVSPETMWSTGQLSKFSDAMFADLEAGLYLIPTSEVPLTALHGGEILAAGDLPRRLVAYSPCFRKEAGAAGKDTRGLIRMHQFEKVELVWLSRPDASEAALEQLTADAEALLTELELPFRTLLLCSGDTGFNAAKTYDLEVWLPGQDSYREISSCSNCTDFQARRAQIRFRPEPRAKPELVHTLNGSGLALGRTLVAVLENGQREDGSVRIPSALVPYTGFDVINLP